jgi:hypothetical protein
MAHHRRNQPDNHSRPTRIRRSSGPAATSRSHVTDRQEDLSSDRLQAAGRQPESFMKSPMHIFDPHSATCELGHGHPQNLQARVAARDGAQGWLATRRAA